MSECQDRPINTAGGMNTAGLFPAECVPLADSSLTASEGGEVECCDIIAYDSMTNCGDTCIPVNEDCVLSIDAVTGSSSSYHVPGSGSCIQLDEVTVTVTLTELSSYSETSYVEVNVDGPEGIGVMRVPILQDQLSGSNTVKVLSTGTYTFTWAS